MSDLEISVNDSYESSSHVIEPLLAAFKEQHHANVSLTKFNWEDAWAEFMKISLYERGPVISQTGNSWMGSLIARNSLRIFREKELAELGGKRNFLPESWASCLDFDDESAIAIPWILDTYLVYYRRDLLEKAGLNPATAFSTLDDLHVTLQTLQESGIQYPFVLPTHQGRSLVHVVASWVWGEGGDFIDADGTRTAFSQRETRNGLRKHFELFRFMTPEAKQIDDLTSWTMFHDGKAAVTVRNAALLFQLKQRRLPAELAENVGVALIPGVPLLGGSHFVVWRHLHSQQEQNMVDLIKFLTSVDSELTLFEETGLLPANVEALERVAREPLFVPAVQSVRTGRSFPRVRLWGLVEDKLMIALSQVWQELLGASTPNVDASIARYLDPIEARLNMALAQ